MPSINYDFIPNQDVYVITTASDGAISIRAATVLRFYAQAVHTGVEMFYDVRYDANPGNIQIKTTDIFATLSEAVAEYEVRLS